MKPFPYPLTLESLEAFCHPRPLDPLSLPRMHQGEAIAANGYICLRCDRGHWLPTDFEAADPAFVRRFEKLPWHRFDRLPADEWRLLEDVRHRLFKYAPVQLWRVPPARQDEKHRLSPCPIWRIGYCSPVRLSLLQLIARLPRCEVFIGDLGTGDRPTYFRFAGGRGIIAADALLSMEKVSFHLFSPHQHGPLDRGELKTAKLTKPPTLSMSLPNWPPTADPDQPTIHD